LNQFATAAPIIPTYPNFYWMVVMVIKIWRPRRAGKARITMSFWVPADFDELFPALIDTIVRIMMEKKAIASASAISVMALSPAEWVNFAVVIGISQMIAPVKALQRNDGRIMVLFFRPSF
jgi:hypothetical protein